MGYMYGAEETESMRYQRWVDQWGEYAANNTDMFDPYWLDHAKPDDWAFNLLGSFVAIVGMLSFVGNSVVCYTFIRSPSLRNQKLFTVNLSLSDAISPLLTYHMFVISSQKQIWIFTKTTCEYYALVQGWCGLVSIVSLAAIALERYYKMVSPHGKLSRLSINKKLGICIGIWLYCLAVCLPPLFGFGNYVAAGFLITCCFDYIHRTWQVRGFILYLFGGGLIVPMSVIIFCYFKIYYASKESIRILEERMKAKETTTLQLTKKGEQPDPNIRGTTPRPASTASSTIRPPPIIKGKDKRLAQLMLLVIVLFVIAWTPYAVVALLGQFGSPGAVTPWMAMIPSVFAKSSTLWNPVLYAVKDTRFQRGFKKYVLCQELPTGVMTDSMTTKSEKQAMGAEDELTERRRYFKRMNTAGTMDSVPMDDEDDVNLEAYTYQAEPQPQPAPSPAPPCGTPEALDSPKSLKPPADSDHKTADSKSLQ